MDIKEINKKLNLVGYKIEIDKKSECFHLSKINEIETEENGIEDCWVGTLYELGDFIRLLETYKK